MSSELTVFSTESGARILAKRYGLGSLRGPCGREGVETSYIQVSEPMDWEDIPQVRASNRSKVSEPVIINVPLQDEAVPPQPK
ncbi:hypothetical protein TNCV_1988861 [Trichonephila clavipes]|nr:hypothetical protein TNCV_1988861 [Trichonephila clavipes]